MITCVPSGYFRGPATVRPCRGVVPSAVRGDALAHLPQQTEQVQYAVTSVKIVWVEVGTIWVGVTEAFVLVRVGGPVNAGRVCDWRQIIPQIIQVTVDFIDEVGIHDLPNGG